MMSYAMVDGFTEVERHEAIHRLKSCIADAEGVIVDFAFFSNKAIRLSVELEAGALARLRDALEASDVHVFEKSAVEIEKARTVTPATKPVIALLHVTFMAEEADLAMHVPAVGG